MQIITKNNRVLTLMGLYHPGKFESAPILRYLEIACLQARLRNKQNK